MSSHLMVVNSAAKTVKIPTTPAKYLTEVRDEACKKFNINPDQFTLKYNNKPISLSQQVRHCNLPPGARLELVQSSRSPTVISVALQLPATEKNVRLTQKFSSNTSLWEILRHFESAEGANYNFTQRGVPEVNASGSGAGRLNYEMPVVTVMPGHREQSSFVALQQTLSKLGFDSGSALLRLSFKNSGTPLEEAMAEITQYFKADSVAPDAQPSSSAQAASVPDQESAVPEASQAVPEEPIQYEEPEQPIQKKELDPEPMDVDSTPAPEPTPAPPSLGSPATVGNENSPPSLGASPSSAPLNRNVQIFAAPTSSTPQAARRDFNPNDYEPTIEHAKAHQAALQARTRNQRLLSDKELAEQEAVRAEKVNAVAQKGGSLRIRMPDQTQIQMDISKADTASGLYDFVTSFLEHSDQPFLLKYLGPKGGQVAIEKDQKRLIQDLRFSGREVVTFAWDENASDEARMSRGSLVKEWRDKAQTLKVEEPVVQDQQKPETASMSKSDGKRKLGGGGSGADKESKLKNLLNKGLFKR
ncbi:GLUT4 regulating protein TUG-domain-containing protein [Clohesyomyces aquaticus]|uniref:GLUT4 regulating protein TUG-domain-containing protein n=1 Tax=Clohesyomyces aquaticus TaxID=1231657 RepID=A0A1Y1ZMZ6_9PLEO|nr:GLUT4 regulating protein TUG-domain-containing protein [Clohesyomyces aquaticus]